MARKHGHSLHDYVVRAIGQKIVSGKWPVGETIPDLNTLRAGLKVSTTALREALIALATKGLIEAKQKIGTIVQPREEWNMLDAGVLSWRVDSEEGEYVIAELYELRQLIEPLAASLAATHATRREIERLQSAYEDMVVAGDDGDKVLDPDVRFHRGIIAASGNSLFASVGLIIAAALEVNFDAIKESPRGHAWALPLHKAILDAIAAHDAKAARLAMQKLLKASEEDLRSLRNAKTKRPQSRRTS
jgi:GntR family galactonate operon transcriptional repressor